MEPLHLPVLADEVVELMVTRTSGAYVDCTVGCGGHAQRILERDGGGRLLAVDLDDAAIAAARSRLARFEGAVEFATGNFAELAETARSRGFDGVDGVLFDLGFSSAQLDDPERGFSFSADGPIDMRLDRTGARSAGDVLAHVGERELAEIISEYGEERRSRPIARAIVAARDAGRLRTTADLAAAVLETRPQKRTKTLARVFQALRIAVNDELNNLTAGLEAAVDLLRPGGRVVVISYHSLEDRIVKRFFARCQDPCTCPPDLPECVCGLRPTLRVLTKKVVRPGAAELAANPRARSAKLRAAERLEVAQ